MSIYRGPVLFILSALSGLASTVPVTNPNFSIPTIGCTLGYAYDGSGGCNGIFSNGVPDPQQNFNAARGFGWDISFESVFKSRW